MGLLKCTFPGSLPEILVLQVATRPGNMHFSDMSGDSSAGGSRAMPWGKLHGSMDLLPVPHARIYHVQDRDQHRGNNHTCHCFLFSAFRAGSQDGLPRTGIICDRASVQLRRTQSISGMGTSHEVHAVVSPAEPAAHTSPSSVSSVLCSWTNSTPESLSLRLAHFLEVWSHYCS